MAKTRKATRKPAAKRSAKTKRTVTAKLKGRKPAKAKARTAMKKKGVIASAVEAMADAVRLRTRLGGHNRFEDQ